MRADPKRVVCICVAAAAALALAGCFDLELTLKLNSDGTGTLATRAILAKEWVQMGAQGKPPESKLLGNGTRVRRKSELRNGQLVQEEATDFETLSQLRGMEGSDIEVTKIGNTFWGAERSRVRWTVHTSKRHSDASPPDPRVIDAVLDGHIIVTEIDVPCTVTQAETVKLNFANAPAYINNDIIHGSSVRWVVPLKALFATPNGKITFELECWSFSGIKPGHTPD